MLENIIDVKRVCLNCGNLNKVTEQVLKKEEFCCEGEWIDLIYFECPSCKTINVVQADNEYTKGLLKGCRDVIFDSMDEDGENHRKKIEKRYKAKSERLRKARENLNKRLEGEKVYKKDGEIFLKHLTVIQ